jgi:hypothetical protein
MSDMFRVYVALRLRDGSTGAVVRSAMELHLFAAVVGKFEGRPGFVSDALLSTLDGVDTATCALELEIEGLWVRVDSGYRLNAPRLSRAVSTDSEATHRWARRHLRGE